MSLQEQLAEIKAQALAAIEASDAEKSLNDVRVKFLGKKGEITSVLRGMKDLSADERPQAGKLANEVRDAIQSQLDEKKAATRAAATIFLFIFIILRTLEFFVLHSLFFTYLFASLEAHIESLNRMCESAYGYKVNTLFSISTDSIESDTSA